ncbi:hypothetical protein HDU67_006517 [Dinochytrium kinnereticum]|nr:hypothetical protein HDU67_006517 [Dinochytrium kinnereticum]
MNIDGQPEPVIPAALPTMDDILQPFPQRSRQSSAQLSDSGIGGSHTHAPSDADAGCESQKGLILGSDLFTSLSFERLSLLDSPSQHHVALSGNSHDDEVDRLVSSAVEDLRRRRESITFFKTMPKGDCVSRLDSIVDEEAPPGLALDDDDLFPPEIPVILIPSSLISKR